MVIVDPPGQNPPPPEIPCTTTACVLELEKLKRSFAGATHSVVNYVMAKVHSMEFPKF